LAANMTVFSQKLVARMEELGIPPSQIATDCGVTEYAVRNWMSGANPPRRTVMPLLAKALRIDVRDLKELPATDG